MCFYQAAIIMTCLTLCWSSISEDGISLWLDTFLGCNLKSRFHVFSFQKQTQAALSYIRLSYLFSCEDNRCSLFKTFMIIASFVELIFVRNLVMSTILPF